MRRLATTLLLAHAASLASLVGSGGCGTAPPAEPVAVETVEGDEIEVEVRPALHLDGTPYDEEWTRVDLVWRGEPAALPLYETMEVPTEQSGAYPARPGEVVPYVRSEVVVYEPLPMRALVPMELGMRPYDRASGKLGPVRTVILAEGEILQAYKYAGEGTCYLGHGGEVFVGGCPDTDRFAAEGWGGGPPVPSKYNWWVFVEGGDGDGGEGWVNVEETALEPRLVDTMPDAD